MAADLLRSNPPVIRAPTPLSSAPVSAWSGFYLGVHGGGSIGEVTTTALSELANQSLIASARKIDRSGPMGGVQAGFALRSGALVSDLSPRLRALYVDSHCHLDFPELAADVDSLLDAMRAARVTHALCISVDLADWPRVHKLAQDHANLYATAGVHPDYPDTEEPTVERLVELAARPKDAPLNLGAVR